MEKIIIWIEDRPDTVSSQIRFLRDKSFKVYAVATVNRLNDLLEQHKNEIVLIIVDIMLYSVKTLLSIDIDDAPTEEGFRAGWVIMDRLLRPESGNSDYYDVPILIVSSQIFNDDNEERLVSIAGRGGAWIEYIEKGEIDTESNITWIEKFSKTIEAKLIRSL
ncbi:hypothetical protein [Desulfosudis oleivorans]|uniref:Response regulator n=1 Tax=Desulfosudis oleivorans (strain DSM 6200 / JCM 39069 / Hxd3) TaxID=96561 RepID=A8ZZS7_DESOH|nr:hypothetical protein [Desulfosudis oleivorans]ABW68949.1 hypothetical protein Dole_3146 [Desulfosudis oleivorans Hxd3]